ncbi:MAG: hypothetical protein R2847_05760 [Bacteroidia bacterium]
MTSVIKNGVINMPVNYNRAQTQLHNLQIESSNPYISPGKRLGATPVIVGPVGK